MAQARTWQRALVTGASSGIGEAMCRQLAASGADLVVVARSEERLEALAAELRARSGIEVEVLAADLADPEALARVEARVAATEASVELVVNNAGFGFNGSFGEVPVEDETREVAVNVTALMRLSHAAVARMRRTRWGGILNVSSVASFQPSAGGTNYAATKSYVTSLSLGLHEELRDEGVHVSVLCPGFTRTEFQERGGWADLALPDVVWQSADAVAAEGLAGVAENRAMTVPGLHNKSLHVVTKLMPGAAMRRVAGAVSGRFS